MWGQLIFISKIDNMHSDIQLLPTEVVHLIAAGEVIDSLAAVVRELAENALDAGATRIVISLWPMQWRVRVADNGCGMDLKDLQQAAKASSTSKIRSCEDLWKINSLGFRGEALHSLAQLAELEVLSRKALCEGWYVRYCSQGQARQIEACAIAPGTVVTVSDLFGNWATRRAGLPPLPIQMKAVQAIIWQIALCHPHVTWQVWQSDRVWFTLSPGATTGQLLPQILRQIRASDLQELKLELTPQSSIQVVLGLPDRCHRHRPDWVRVAVNRRMVKLPEIEQTVFKATARTLPRDRYPICLLHLHVAPDRVDWNRHPAKAEIYLHQLSYWQEQTTLAIEQALRLSPANLPEAVHTKRVGKLLKAAESQGVYGTSRSIPTTPDDPEAATDTAPLIPLRAVAQVHNTYILAEHPSGLWLVEQHIAHERVLYEQLVQDWQIVPKEPPAILKALSPAQQLQLQRIGLELEPFGENLWAIRTAPAALIDRDDCAEALMELALGGDLQTAQVATACRTAIRNGTPLSLIEMQTLLDRWRSTRNPRTCPHGRPIYLSLEESALSRFFRRHWVIGKSHGI